MPLEQNELAQLKQYLRIDHDEEDALLEQFYKRAKISIKNQVGPVNLEDEDMKEQFDQACALLVGHWYENREAVRIGNNSYEIPHSLNSLIREMRYCYEVSDEE